MHPFKSIPKPTIAFGSTAPGVMTFVNNEPKWQGDLVWEVNHGQAKSLWVAGKLAAVYDARLADGSRDEELKNGPADTKIWRRCLPGDNYVHGTITLDAEDIVFTDMERQPSPTKWAANSLPNSLMRTKEAVEAVANDGFAADLYGALCSSVWISDTTGKEYHGDWARTADIVVQMRGKGEIFADFFLNGNEGIITSDITAMLSKIGWKLGGMMEASEQKMMRAERLVNICEARPPAEMPDWYVQWITGLSNGKALDNRLHRAAFAGKVAYKEWIKFWEYFDFDE